MSEALLERIRKSRDEDLIRTVIGGEREGYLPEVVREAQEELARRGVRPTDIFQVEDAMINDRIDAIERRGGSRRPAFYVFAIVGGFGLLLIFGLASKKGSRAGRLATEAGIFGAILWAAAIALQLLFRARMPG